MAHVFNGDFSKLKSPERKKLLPVDKILGELNLKGTVIDFGCGIGYFTLPLAKIVDKVIAIDLSEDMLDELKKRITTENIELIKSDNLENFEADTILLIQVLHEIDNPKDFILDCFDASDKLVIIDYYKKESLHGPPINHRIAKEDVIAMCPGEVIEHELNDELYFLEIKRTTKK